jgi:hypothetical protein
VIKAGRTGCADLDADRSGPREVLSHWITVVVSRHVDDRQRLVRGQRDRLAVRCEREPGFKRVGRADRLVERGEVTGKIVDGRFER